jgi:hypothetical protein
LQSNLSPENFRTPSIQSRFIGTDLDQSIQWAEPNRAGEQGNRAENQEDNSQCPGHNPGEVKDEENDSDDDPDDPVQIRFIDFHFKHSYPIMLWMIFVEEGG